MSMKEIEEELKKRKGRPAHAIKAHKEHQAEARKFINEAEASFVIIKVTPGGTETLMAITDTEQDIVRLAQGIASSAKKVLEVVLDHDSHAHINREEN